MRSPATHCVCPGCGRIAKRSGFPRGVCRCRYENPDEGRMPTVQDMLTKDYEMMNVNPRAFLNGVLKVFGVRP